MALLPHWRHRLTIPGPQLSAGRLTYLSAALERLFYTEDSMRAEYREEPCRTALNRVKGMGFRWSLNPYMGCAHRCAFCYVRGFERRADRPWGEAYGSSVRVKTNVVEVLRRELARRSWKRELVAIGAATDPYQPAEGRYRLTRGCIGALAEARTPLSLITRGPLVVRDIDVLAEASRRAEVSVHVSIATLDPALYRWLEPGVAPPHARLRAIRRLSEAGIRAGLALAPVLPGLTDAPEQLAAVIAAGRDAGATHMWSNVLNLRPGTREHFVSVLAREWPDQLSLYERLYPASGSGYLAAADGKPLEARLKALREREPITDRRRIRLDPEPEPAQLALTLGAAPPAEPAVTR